MLFDKRKSLTSSAVTSGADSRPVSGRTLRVRTLTVLLGAGLAFAGVSAQLVRLGFHAQSRIVVAQAEPVASTFARPDITDRNGHLMATDIAMPSLYADPQLVLNRDQLAEELATVLPDLDVAALRLELSGPNRRFVWIRRGLSPRLAQRVHDLGLPGLAFRNELRRAYPMGSLGGHLIGAVNIDNKGTQGIERYIDTAIGVEGVHAATRSGKGPVRLSLDIGVQHTVEDELETALRRYRADAAAGIVIDANTGEVIASASLPPADPMRPSDLEDAARFDRVAGGTFELGSIFKMVTIAMVLDGGLRGLDSIVDVTEPLVAGRYTIKDSHAAGRPLTVSEIFTHSSNVGAGLLALEAGPELQKAFLGKLGLLTPLMTERGPVAEPIVPARFERAEQITVAYGHGLAVAPLQFAAAAAAMVNGGYRVTPTFLAAPAGNEVKRERIISSAASARMRELMRLNVTDAAGTGNRADVKGYEVGGKTGTAEMAVKGGYAEKKVIASFVAAFPMSRPKYLVHVSLFAPHGETGSAGEITAGTNAAPVAGRIIARIAPQLGVMPDTRHVAGLAE